MTPGLTLPFDSFMTCLQMRSTQHSSSTAPQVTSLNGMQATLLSHHAQPVQQIPRSQNQQTLTHPDFGSVDVRQAGVSHELTQQNGPAASSCQPCTVPAASDLQL